MREPFQVLVFPYHIDAAEKADRKSGIKYCLFKRADMGIWQGISGGGEDTETPLEAAKREAFEEAKIKTDRFHQLIATAFIPAADIGGLIWGPKVTEVPEYAFGVQLPNQEIHIAHEHSEFAWLFFEQALAKLEFESNKLALAELNQKLLNSQKS